MQFDTQISGSIISVVQGLILLFVAADAIIRWLYRLPIKSETPTLTLAPAAVLAEGYKRAGLFVKQFADAGGYMHMVAVVHQTRLKGK
jgi:hypothetical protein